MRFFIIAGLVGFLAAGAQSALAEPVPDRPRLHPLEGVLMVHPKYLYRYYVVFGDGQKCALYGPDHRREPESLSGLQPGTRIRVRGVLGTSYFPGGNKENPSPFPAGWVLYMDVHEVEAIQKE